jgi:hypothetical protein
VGRARVDGENITAWTYDISGDYSMSKDECRGIILQYKIGNEYTCWYDPSSLKDVVLIQGNPWRGLFLIVPLIFISGCVWVFYKIYTHHEKSPEINTLERTNQDETLAKSLVVDMQRYPYVSRIDTKLAHHLKYSIPMDPPESREELQFLFFFCLFWNGILSFLVCSMIVNWKNEDWPILWLLFLLPFVAAGIFVAYILITKLLIKFGVNPTEIEIAEHPWYPGGKFKAWFSQSGNLSFRKLAVELICEERASYTRGTDIRTETKVVYRQILFQRGDFRITTVTALEEELICEIPNNMMHSFKANCNEIQWKLFVKGILVLWPKFERSYPVIVYPKISST